MVELSNAHRAARLIEARLPSFKPIIGLVLGSGLGSMSEHIEDAVIIPYEELPGFPEITVKGHHGNVICGRIRGVDVVCLQGRAHTYEGNSHEVVKTYVRTLKCLGCTYFLATNASGSLREEVGPGELVLITDHINLQADNPLTGPNDDAFGPRFYPLDNAYDKALQERFLRIAQQEAITLHEGVYISVTGPHYETPAEIRAFKMLGADAIGMSTVPEILVANHCGMKAAVIATITNYATGLTTISHSHEEVVATAARASQKTNQLITAFIADLGK